MRRLGYVIRKQIFNEMLWQNMIVVVFTKTCNTIITTTGQ